MDKVRGLELAYRDPVISKLRHDAENKHTAFLLLTGLIERTGDPMRREDLRNKAIEQMALWDAAFEEYRVALRRAVSKYEAEGNENGLGL